MKVRELTDRAVDADSIARKRCFACGGPPSTGAGEHVIPKWLQKAYRLHDQKLTLLNGTLLPYRSLTVPCCADCNTGFLAGIERSAEIVFRSGMPSDGTDELVLARWLSKILIGILVKETALAFDRTNPADGPIIDAEALDELRHCHYVMQSARKKTRFDCLHSVYPFSFFAYRICESRTSDFDLSTNIIGQSIAMRVGQLGVVFVNDGGLQMEVGPQGPFALAGSVLSPVQFKEMSARIHYKSFLRDATHLYLSAETPEDLHIAQVKVSGNSGYVPGTEEIQIFRSWDDAEFSHFLAAHMGLNQQDLFDTNTRQCRTTLGNLLYGEEC